MSVRTALLAISIFSSAAASAPYDSTTSSFDYVIVGGGTSGLVVANRLSENPNVTVAVIEAGASVYNDSRVTDVNGYGTSFDTEIDYAYSTVNQTYAGGNKMVMRAGKAIGGTSTINGMAYVRAQNVQIDHWEAIGNKGWNWEALSPYFNKSESIQPPTAAQQEAGYVYDSSVHGTTGPLKVGWLSSTANASASKLVRETMKNLNVPILRDVNDGLMNGYYQYPQTVDVAKNIRADAGRAYFYPIQNRMNLKLFSSTNAERLVWAKAYGSARASGVEVTSGNRTNVIHARKEVILSAGALRSSVLLEHSGIGNPSVLKAAGVQVVVNLPTVGENLQDQTNAALSGKSNVSITGAQNYVVYPTAADIYGDKIETVKAELLANLTTYAEATAIHNKNVTKADDLLKFFKLQYDLTFDGKTPMLEVIISTSGGAISLQSWTLLPFSRGSIHITSANASIAANIDPNYFDLPWDSLSQVQSFRWMRNLTKTAPFSSIVASETAPGSSVSQAGTDEEWFSYIKSTFRSNFHPIGSTAMMPREIGGVVDASLMVYGTSNVRVVDAGILPFQVCGHLTSTLYAVAEKAAEIIKAESSFV